MATNELPLRRTWSSARARADAYEPLVRLLNTMEIRGHEKHEVLELLKKNPGYTMEILAAVRETVEARAALAPAGLHDWGRRQGFSRAYARTSPDLSTPSYFNGRFDTAQR